MKTTTIILFAACLCLLAALAMGQTTTTQTVDASNANFAYEGDAVGTFIGTSVPSPLLRVRSHPAVSSPSRSSSQSSSGEPTIKSADEATTTTGELAVYGLLVADIAAFFYLFSGHQGTNHGPDDQVKSLV
jgi:hypothetical protein